MKKFAIACLFVVLAGGLLGCGDKKGETKSTVITTGTQSSTNK